MIQGSKLMSRFIYKLKEETDKALVIKMMKTQ